MDRNSPSTGVSFTYSTLAHILKRAELTFDFIAVLCKHDAQHVFKFVEIGVNVYRLRP